MLPYLKVKKRQSIIGIEFQKTSLYQSKSIPQQIKIKRNDLIQKLRILNRRGKLILEIEAE